MTRWSESQERLAERMLARFGESVTRWPLGVEADAESVTAIVDLDEETAGGQAAIGGVAVLDGSKNEKIVRRGKLEVSSSQSVDDRDKWEINSELWSALRISGRDDGMVTVEIEKVVRIHSTRR